MPVQWRSNLLCVIPAPAPAQTVTPALPAQTAALAAAPAAVLLP